MPENKRLIKGGNNIKWANLDVATKVNAILTLVIILLTGINLWMQVRTTNQAQKSLKMNEESIGLLKNQFITLNRPYLSIRGVIGKKLEKGIELRAFVKNSGNTPALIVSRELEDLYGGKATKSKDASELLVSPGEEINILFMYIPPNSTDDITPFHEKILYKSNLSDEQYQLEYWGKYKDINSVAIDRVKYN